MLASDLQEALIEDGFAFIQGVLLEGCVCGVSSLGHWGMQQCVKAEQPRPLLSWVIYSGGIGVYTLGYNLFTHITH